MNKKIERKKEDNAERRRVQRPENGGKTGKSQWRPPRQDQQPGSLPQWSTDRDNDPDGDRVGQ